MNQKFFFFMLMGITFLGCNAFQIKVLSPHNDPLLKVQSAAMGGGTACAQLDDGKVSCWGNGLYGQLLSNNGWVGETPEQMGDNLVPIYFGTGKFATYIQGTSWGQCAILNDQTVKCWGNNGYGQLGYGDTALRTRPTPQNVQLGTGKTPVKIVGGMYFHCALFTDGTVKCWGRNDYGQLGLGDKLDRGDGPNEMGDNLPTVDLGTDLGIPLKARELYAGSYHVCAILENDRIKCWGQGSNGRLGYENAVHRGDDANEMGDNLPFVNLGTGRTVKKMSLGSHQSCAILDNDLVKCWGTGSYGRLGSGAVAHLGDNAGEMGDGLPYLDFGTGRTVKEIQYGYAIGCAILDDNSVKCWGYNGQGALGVGDTIDRGDQPGEMGDNLPVTDLGSGVYAVSLHSQTNSNSMCAILNTNQLKCWGVNGNLQAGSGSRARPAIGDEPNEMGDDLQPVNLGTSKYASMVSVNTDSICVLLSDQTTRCWGQNIGPLGKPNLEIGNDRGEKGLNLPRLSLGTGLTLKQIFPGYTTCALFTNGALKCWGYGTFGGNGQGSTSHIGPGFTQFGDGLPFVNLGTGRTVSKLFQQGAQHLCALLDDNSLKCWGYNVNGQLGLGDTGNRGDAANEMGDNLPEVNLGTGRTAIDVAIGWLHTCAILDNASVKCWGNNQYGQLGVGHTTQLGDGANEMGDNLPTVNLGVGRTAKSITAGNYHTCAILDDNSVKCWGLNLHGQLGQGDVGPRGVAAIEMGDNLSAVDLGVGRTAVSIVAGGFHSCAILDNGQAKCWGRNHFGQLGKENYLNIGDDLNEMGDFLTPINLGPRPTLVSLLAGVNTNNTCALFTSGELKCWGQGNYGILVRESDSSYGGQINQMGASLPAIDFGIRN